MPCYCSIRRRLSAIFYSFANCNNVGARERRGDGGSEGRGGVMGRVIDDRCVDRAVTVEGLYHSMQSSPQSRITMTTMLDRPTIITSDIVAITTP